MKQVTVGEYTYTSISAAWRELSPPNLKLVTVRWRLKNGWDAAQALLTEPVDPKIRRIFKKLRA